MQLTAVGAALTALCGIALWLLPLGQPWVTFSYDYLFKFGTRAITNNVALIVMDNEAHEEFHQDRSQPWDRALHAKLLNKLADDGCALVVMDCFFRAPGDAQKDRALMDAMRRQRKIALMASQSSFSDGAVQGVQPLLPAELFLGASRTNWGVAWFDPDPDLIVRRQWPSATAPYLSLAESAARSVGANLSEWPHERWLRYYGEAGQWKTFSYGFALKQPANYFRDRIVFIGNQPETFLPDQEQDKFQTPYTRWTGETMGGVELNVTAFLNLVNNDSLLRLPWWAEVLILMVTGAVIGLALSGMRPIMACVCAIATALGLTVAAVSYSYLTNYWFPWLVIAGGQVPCALGWSIFKRKIFRPAESTQQRSESLPPRPAIPDYELIDPPFGHGAYGRVWLARNRKSQWRAVKVIYLSNFNNDSSPFDREFNGISRYAPISDKHPGLLPVEFVSEKFAEYFYYVMELGDSREPGWEDEPPTYKPRDLASERAKFPNRRLSMRECVRIGVALSDALDFLHQQGLTHRDIKPQNVIFVGGQPKLADLGLISEIRPLDQERTSVGTPGYMPPLPERPGTPQADIYALGIMLYVLSTGRDTAFFPEVSTTMLGSEESVEYLGLNDIILKACKPDPAERYASASELRVALQQIEIPALEK